MAIETVHQLKSIQYQDDEPYIFQKTSLDNQITDILKNLIPPKNAHQIQS